MPRRKMSYGPDSKKKLTKYKIIPNYATQNQVQDMANFEINFLSNHKKFFLQTHKNILYNAYYNFCLSIFGHCPLMLMVWLFE